MSKQDNLHDFLTDIADAVREKKGTSEKINAQNISSEIRGIESEEVYAFGSNMTDSGKGVSNIIEITINDTTTRIESYAYRNLINLANVNLPKSLTYMGAQCFRDCTSLKSIILPKSLNIIDDMVFYGCKSFNLLDCRSLEAIPRLGSSVFTSNPTIVVPDNLYDEWIAATSWSTYADRIVKVSEYQPITE